MNCELITPYPLKMAPVFMDYIWGGTRLKGEYGKQCDLPIVAESWEVSTHPDGLSTVTNGEYAGKTLKAVLERHPQWICGNAELPPGGLPVLIKLIDARERLSLQVHPNDEYALRVEGEHGKNEMWYIMEAQPGAELVLGFDRALGKEELRRLIDSGEIMNAVRRVPVKAGECYTIPAGLLHSIGEGIVLAEVQQASNVTYRVFDYGRVDSAGKARKLHVDKALDVLDTKAVPQKADSDVLVDWEFFGCRAITIRNEELGIRNDNCFACLLVVYIENGGEVVLRYDRGEISLKKGESVFLPAGLGGCSLESKGGQATVLSVTMP